MATIGKAYEKGKRDAFQECYDFLSEIMRKRDGFINHSSKDGVVDYCPCSELRVLGMTLLALAEDEEDSRNGKKNKV